jgi:hypothetical protein
VAFLIVPWVGIALEALLLARGYQTKLFKKYPYFYSYNACVFLAAVLFLVPEISAKGYWVAQFITLFLGCGIVLEIFRHVLGAYPGAMRLAKGVASVVFALTTGVALLYSLWVAPDSLTVTTYELERDLRVVQAILILAILSVIAHYGIQLERQMKGMILGYDLYVGTSLVSLALRAYSETRFFSAWLVVQPSSFDISLIVWVVALWVPVAVFQMRPASPNLEADYEAVVARTRHALLFMRSYLGKAARP